MKHNSILLLIGFFIIPHLILSQENNEIKPSFINYLNEESEAIEVNADLFYYVSAESSEDFLQHMQSSLIAFVKGNQSTSIDEIELEDGENDKTNLTSSCAVQELALEHIEKHLNNQKTYNGLVIKNLFDQKPLNFSDEQVYAVVLYSSKLRGFMEPYLQPLRKLKEQDNIPFVIVTMDTDKLDGLPDAYKEPIMKN